MRYDVASWEDIERILPELDDQDRLHLVFRLTTVRVRVEAISAESDECRSTQ